MALRASQQEQRYQAEMLRMQQIAANDGEAEEQGQQEQEVAEEDLSLRDRTILERSRTAEQEATTAHAGAQASAANLGSTLVWAYTLQFLWGLFVPTYGLIILAIAPLFAFAHFGVTRRILKLPAPSATWYPLIGLIYRLKPSKSPLHKWVLQFFIFGTAMLYATMGAAAVIAPILLTVEIMNRLSSIPFIGGLLSKTISLFF